MRSIFHSYKKAILLLQDWDLIIMRYGSVIMRLNNVTLEQLKFSSISTLQTGSLKQRSLPEWVGRH